MRYGDAAPAPSGSVLNFRTPPAIATGFDVKNTTMVNCVSLVSFTEDSFDEMSI